MGTRSLGATTAVRVVEAAYRLDGPSDAWVERLLEAASKDLAFGCGIYAFTATRTAGRILPDAAFVTRGLEPSFVALLGELQATAPADVLQVLSHRLVTCGGLAQTVGPKHVITRHFRTVCASAGIVDGFSLFADDMDLGGFVMSSPTRVAVWPSDAVLDVWRRVGMHVGAGLRLRRRLARGDAPTEAWLSPGGDVLHAEGVAAASSDARDALRRAVRRIERAKRLRRDPAEALSLWRGLTEGRWSLVERWEQDGRRYLVAHANPPGARDPRALSKPERAVLALVERGATNKEIAFALGMPLGTIATHVRALLGKLGGKRRQDLIGLAGAHIAHVEPGIAIAVSEPLVIPGLSPAEQALVPPLLRGATVAAIARQTARSARTIENQLGTIYAKVGVRNRAALVARLSSSNGSVGRRTRLRSSTDAE